MKLTFRGNFVDIHHDTAKLDVCKVCNLMSLTDIDACGSITSMRRLSKPITHKVLCGRLVLPHTHPETCRLLSDHKLPCVHRAV